MGVALQIVDAEDRTTSLGVRINRRGEDGLLEVDLWTAGSISVSDAIERWGRMPLPPYVKRDAEASDAARYQTVYARVPGAVAAPTAGLHLSRALLGRLAVRGCSIATVTLHVGLGTFQPVTCEDLDDHVMHAERYEVPDSTASFSVLSQEKREKKKKSFVCFHFFFLLLFSAHHAFN